MKKIIIVCWIFSIVYITSLFGQGKAVEAGVEVTNTAEITGDTKEARTIKVEEQAPGVITEYKEDGTKVVTINLSEVDENKLPEKYEAEVILEAPIVMGEQELPTDKNGKWIEGTLLEVYKGKIARKTDRENIIMGEKNITPSGVFLDMPEGGMQGNFYVQIDGRGNIYILDLYNSRIQKFNNEGKHIKNIMLKDEYEVVKIKGEWETRKNKNNFVVDAKGRIYIRDTAQNRIEAIDESGNVVETIDIPEKIDGKDTREMKMWADEEGVGVGEPLMNLRLTGKKKGKDSKSEGKDFIKKSWHTKEKYFNKSINPEQTVIWNLTNTLKVLLKHNKGEIIDIYNLANDRNNYYFNCGIYLGREGNTLKVEDKIIKISFDGKIIAAIEFNKYWRDKEWNDKCGQNPKTWSGNTFNNIFFDKQGNIYLLQTTCCPDKECVSQIRIIKLGSK